MEKRGTCPRSCTLSIPEVYFYTAEPQRWTRSRSSRLGSLRGICVRLRPSRYRHMAKCIHAARHCYARAVRSCQLAFSSRLPLTSSESQAARWRTHRRIYINSISCGSSCVVSDLDTCKWSHRWQMKSVYILNKTTCRNDSYQTYDLLGERAPCISGFYLFQAPVEALLPEIESSDAGKICVVIDLDETLIHSSFKVSWLMSPIFWTRL